MADTSAIDAAVMAILSSDATLTTLLPGGVHWDLATAGATKFVIVSQVEHGDTYTLPGACLWERVVYLVKAVASGTSGTAVKDGAARIHTLLQDTTLTVTAYHPAMVVQRVQRVRYTEVDEVTDARWHHRGGHYEVLITPQ